MPSYFNGDTPVVDDAIRIARQLTGMDELDSDERQRADLDQDENVGAADLLLMLKAANQGLSLPLEMPRLDRIRPSIARPGDSLTLEGEHLSASGAPPIILLRSGDEEYEIAGQNISDTSISIATPATLTSENVGIRILRGGLLSNERSAILRPGPILDAITPEFAAAGASIELAGKGFGSDLSLVSVNFNDTPMPPDNANDNLISVTVPTGLTRPISVAVERDSHLSEALSFAYADLQTGTVELPSAGPLNVDELEIVSDNEPSATIQPNGDYALSLPVDFPFTLEAQDNEHDTILAATVFEPTANLVVNAQSTALWLAFFGTNAYALPLAQQRELRDTLSSSAQLSSLASVIVTHYPSQPKLFELAEQPAVDTAYRDALSLAQEQIALFQATANPMLP